MPRQRGHAVVFVLALLACLVAAALLVHDSGLVKVRDDMPLAPYLRRLIEGSLDDLARNRLPKVAKDLNITVDEVKDLAVALRRNFDPFPGRRFAWEPPMRVRPDAPGAQA